jgi:hypothetical protein
MAAATLAQSPAAQDAVPVKIILDRMEFDAQGLIRPVQITHQGVARRTLVPAIR